MNHLILYSSKDTPGKHDSSGAFRPKAEELALLVSPTNCVFNGIDCSVPQFNRRKRVFDLFDRIEKQENFKLDCVSMFCHGWSVGIQFGFDFRNVSTLAHRFSRVSTPELIVNLFCCSTADGPDMANENYPDDDVLGTPAPGTDGGFADQLRDHLCRFAVKNCRVVSHRTRGHCTDNPFVVFFDGDGTLFGEEEDSYFGGKWVIDPKDDLWPRWKTALRETDLKYRMGGMSLDEIKKELL